MARKQSGFTLIEVLVAFAIIATALVAVVGLQIDSLRTMDRLTQRIESNLWAEDAYLRFILNEQGYTVEKNHPKMAELHPEWTTDAQMEDLQMEDLPFIPVMPEGWKINWVKVTVMGESSSVLAETRPLWVRSENDDFTSQSPGGISGNKGSNDKDDQVANE